MVKLLSIGFWWNRKIQVQSSHVPSCQEISVSYIRVSFFIPTILKILIIIKDLAGIGLCISILIIYTIYTWVIIFNIKLEKPAIGRFCLILIIIFFVIFKGLFVPLDTNFQIMIQVFQCLNNKFIFNFSRFNFLNTC